MIASLALLVALLAFYRAPNIEAIREAVDHHDAVLIGPSSRQAVMLGMSQRKPKADFDPHRTLGDVQ